MPLAKNTILEGRYRIDSALGQGGMGLVYRGFDLNLETLVAIKENAFQTQEAVAQFKREALLLAKLRHPSLPRTIHPSPVCDALNYLHNQSPPIIHRDVKPQNIKITPDDRAVLVDFGIAKEYIAGEKTLAGAQGVTPGFSPHKKLS